MNKVNLILALILLCTYGCASLNGERGPLGQYNTPKYLMECEQLRQEENRRNNIAQREALEREAEANKAVDKQANKQKRMICIPDRTGFTSCQEY